MKPSAFHTSSSLSAGRRLALCLLAAVPLLLASQAFAWPYQPRGAGSQVEVSVVDRDSGEQAKLYRQRDSVYVAGHPGAKYAIRISNRTGERVLAVMAVDGVNIITGQTGSYEQSGYVLGPWQTQEITGWRKTSNEVAGFVFTALPDSYAARTGRPNDVGVIGVAVFRERPPMRPPEIVGRADSTSQSGSALPADKAEARNESTDQARQAASPAAPPAQADERLGTGHGERETSQANSTTFVRSSSNPVEVVSIQYDSFDNLVRAGVVQPSPMARPRPFPKVPNQGYVPDPPTN